MGIPAEKQRPRPSAVRALWVVLVLIAPLIGPAITLAYPIDSDDTLLVGAFMIFGPFLYVALALYVASVTTPGSWRRSEQPEVVRLYRKYHACQALSILFLGAFEFTTIFLGDPWAREHTQIHLIVLAAYILYAVPALLTLHFRWRLVETCPEG